MNREYCDRCKVVLEQLEKGSSIYDLCDCKFSAWFGVVSIVQKEEKDSNARRTND